MGRRRTGTLSWYRDHWMIRVTSGGVRARPIHLPVGTSEARAREAMAYYADLAAKGALKTQDEPAPGETLATWATRWFEERAKRGLTSTPKDRGRFTKWVLPTLGAVPMTRIKSSDMEALVTKLDQAIEAHDEAESKGRATSTKSMLSWKSAANVWGLVTKAFDDACHHKSKSLRVLVDDPTKGVRGPDDGTRKARSFLTPARFSAFVRCRRVPIAWRVAVAVAVYTYARASELRGMRWEDIRVDDGFMTVHQTMSAEGSASSTKSGVSRIVPIEPELLPLLRAMQGAAKLRAFVLPDDRHMSRGFRHWLKEAGLDEGDLRKSATKAALTWHDLRATGITWRAIRGDAPLEVMDAAGHTEFSTTQKYLRRADVLRGRFGEVFPSLGELVSELVSSTGRVLEIRGETPSGTRVGEVGFEPSAATTNVAVTSEKPAVSSVAGDRTAASKWPKSRPKPIPKPIPAAVPNPFQSGSKAPGEPVTEELPSLARAVRSLDDLWDALEESVG